MNALRKKCLAINTILLAIFVTVPTFAFAQNQPATSYVSYQDLNNYAITLIATYKDAINNYFPDMKSNFSLYAESYNITTVISSQSGAAIWLEFSSNENQRNFTSQQPIELSLFGGYKNTAAVLEIKGLAVFDTFSFYNNTGFNPFTFTNPNSTLILKNATIGFPFESTPPTHYMCVIMKGSNDTSSWSPDNAKSDAKELLYSDMQIGFVTDRKILERYASPELEDKLLEMEQKFPPLGGNSSYYPWSQWQADISWLEDKAINKYGLTSPTGYLNDLINYMNYQTGGGLPTIPPDNTPTPKPSSIESTPIQTINPGVSQSSITPFEQINQSSSMEFRLLFWTETDTTGGWTYLGCIGLFSLAALVCYVTFEEARDKITIKGIIAKLVNGFLAIPFLIFGGIATELVWTGIANFQATLTQGLAVGIVLSVLVISSVYYYKKSQKKRQSDAKT